MLSRDQWMKTEPSVVFDVFVEECTALQAVYAALVNQFPNERDDYIELSLELDEYRHAIPWNNKAQQVEAIHNLREKKRELVPQINYGLTSV
ncbi:MAG: hypothetical protein Q4P66_08720 [Actinomycetaceae bacterium]|nr:hypothetical protein [Actinomycetaceae bacterium]